MPVKSFGTVTLRAGHYGCFLSMFSTQEASRLRQEFWTAFGQYMSPVLSSENEKINWINYKTGIKDIFFRMRTENKTASINIEITSKDEVVQQLYFEQFETLKKIFEERTGNNWQWKLHEKDEYGKTISMIFKEVHNVSILNKKDWPVLIVFFKEGMLSLDDFWNDVKYSWQQFS